MTLRWKDGCESRVGNVVAYFSFVCRHSLEALVEPFQSITVTAAVLKEGGGGGLFRWLPNDRTITEKTD